ncbi:hypothetical protein MF271_19875 (plasmid) [Deinococcus sp. KNUC1210]|uniref:hypothetical protein n=1 Tax=Deinococcus sp. KNUC1210 TaxID=2917691 RepID=UPI001EF11C59|nr:hypothetical protein [Deinococcus sp. KNUC1210]ULH17673.1 hypothetical protein MF271_19875 [Deinococcus sp. KNUC1210]
MKNRMLMAGVVLSVVLASCAPAVMGSQGAPVVAESSTTPARGVAGTTVYVSYTYNRGALTLPDRYFDDLQVNFDARDVAGGVMSPETPAPWLRMNARDLPADWQLTLVAAIVRKNVVKTSALQNGLNIQYTEQLRVIYKLTLPVGAAGQHRATLSFTDGDTGAQYGTIPLQVSAGLHL